MPIRYFLNYYLEFLTVPLAVLVLAFGFSQPWTNTWLNAIVVGYLFWVFVEYGMHRWFHTGPPKEVRRVHMVHHRNPTFVEGSPSTLLAHAYLALTCGLLWFTLGEYVGSPFVAGYLLGYCSYIFGHHAIHEGWCPGRAFAKRHELHHKGWAFNYNLLCPLGGMVFGTYKAAK